MHGTYEANKVMHNSDVIFAVGVRFDDRTTNNLENTAQMRLLSKLMLTQRLSQKRLMDIPIVGDAKLTLKQMLGQLDQASAKQDNQALTAWWKEIEQWRSKQCLRYETSPTKVKPQQAIEMIYRLTKGEAYVTSDVGQHKCLPHYIIPLINLVIG